MSAAMTTAGWAMLVMVAVTAIAAWPVAVGEPRRRHADQLAGRGPRRGRSAGRGHPAGRVPRLRPRAPARTTGRRPYGPATPRPRACSTGTGCAALLGSADSETAQKYGPALYDAKSFTWDEVEKMRQNPAAAAGRSSTAKSRKWMKVAEQIKTEDPEAYEYLQGISGMDRIGAGFIAILAALFFALFDLTASLLVLLGFLIFRWAVIAAPDPRHGRPAAAGERRHPPAGQRGGGGGLQHRHLRHRRGDLPVRGRPDHEHADRCPAGCRWCWSGYAAWSAGCCCGRTGGSPSSAARTRPRRSRVSAAGTGCSSGTAEGAGRGGRRGVGARQAIDGSVVADPGSGPRRATRTRPSRAPSEPTPGGLDRPGTARRAPDCRSRLGSGPSRTTPSAPSYAVYRPTPRDAPAHARRPESETGPAVTGGRHGTADPPSARYAVRAGADRRCARRGSGRRSPGGRRPAAGRLGRPSSSRCTSPRRATERTRRRQRGDVRESAASPTSIPGAAPPDAVALDFTTRLATQQGRDERRSGSRAWSPTSPGGCSTVQGRRSRRRCPPTRIRGPAQVRARDSQLAEVDVPVTPVR